MDSTTKLCISYDFADYEGYIDFNRLTFYKIVLNGAILAIATDTHLIVTDGFLYDEKFHDGVVRLLVDFNEENNRPTAMTWLTTDTIAVGFESGMMVCFNCFGEEIFEYVGNKSAVQNIQVHLSSTVGGKGKSTSVWVLYESGLLVSIPLANVVKGKCDGLMAYKLVDHKVLSDFVFYKTIYSPSIFELEDDATLSVLVGGMNNTFSLYNLGSRLHFQDFSKLAGYMKEKVGGIISKSISSIFSIVGSFSHSQPEPTDQVTQTEDQSLMITSFVDFKDAKRRILRMTIDPSGLLVAAADALGRVLLFDTQINCVVRVWKGLRDARLAWTDVEESNEISGVFDAQGAKEASSGQSKLRLCLCIYAPLLGIISVHRMKHGGCLRIIPVGLNCQLLNVVDANEFGQSVARSILVRSVPDHGSIELREIDPMQRESTDLDMKTSLFASLDGSLSEDLVSAQFDEDRALHASTSTDDMLQQTRQAYDPKSEQRIARKFEEVMHELCVGLQQCCLPADTHESLQSVSALRGAVAIGIVQSTLTSLNLNGFDTEETTLRPCFQIVRAPTLKGGSGNGREACDFHAIPCGKSPITSLDDLARLFCVRQDLVCSSEKLFMDYFWELDVGRMSGSLLRTILQLVERVELTGRTDTAAVLSVDSSKSKVGSAEACSTTVQLSNQFHRSLYSTMLQALLNSDDDVSRFLEREQMLLVDELRVKLKLLSCYESFSAMLISENRTLDSNFHDSRVSSLEGQRVRASDDTSGSVERATSSPLSKQRNTAVHVTDHARFFNSLSEETLTLCRQNNKRAEALCWCLRSLKKGEKLLRLQLQHGSTVVKQIGNAVSPLSREFDKLPGIGHSSIASTRTSLSSAALHLDEQALHVAHLHHGLVGREYGTPQSPLSSDSSPTTSVASHRGLAHRSIPLKKKVLHGAAKADSKSGVDSPTAAPTMAAPYASTTVSVADPKVSLVDPSLLCYVQDSNYVNFSIFRALHTLVKSDTDNVDAALPNAADDKLQLRVQDILEQINAADEQLCALIAQSPKIKQLQKVPSSRIKPALDNNITQEWRMQSSSSALCQALDVDGSTPDWAPTATVMHSLLSLVVAPLLGDIFALNSFGRCLREMGLNDAKGLGGMVQLFVAFVTKQPVVALIEDLLVKHLSTAPFQRWLRDNLLTLQDTFANFVDGWSDAAGDGADPAASNDLQATRDIYLEMLHADCLGGNADSSKRNIEDYDGHDSLPDFDQFVSCILRPAWRMIQRSGRLESAMTLALVVLDTLQAVNDQIERRSYGKSHLRSTIARWENLFRQLRVTLLLKSRLINKDYDFTAANLSRGIVSLHRLLAMDTLNFALRAEQAMEHEERCQEVYKTRLSQVKILTDRTYSTAGDSSVGKPKDTVGSGGGDKLDVLLAWGSVADKRWRDLLSLAAAEDAIEIESLYHEHDFGPDCDVKQHSGHNIKRRKPLLLYFPLHYQSHSLGVYRCILLCERWITNPATAGVDVLSLAVAHLFYVREDWRGAVALELYAQYFLHYVGAFVLLEEDPTAAAADSAHRAGTSGKDVDGRKSSYGLSLVAPWIQKHLHPAAVIQKILPIISSVGSLRKFVKAMLSMLEYMLSSIEEVEANSAASSKEDAEAVSVDVGGSFNADDELLQDANWPPVNDGALAQLFKTFPGKVRRGTSAHSRSKLWASNVVNEHSALLLALLLRYFCGLRGLQPSKIVGNLSSIAFLDVAGLCSVGDVSKQPSSVDAVRDSRQFKLEFLKQCLAYVVSAESSAPTRKTRSGANIEESHAAGGTEAHSATRAAAEGSATSRGQSSTLAALQDLNVTSEIYMLSDLWLLQREALALVHIHALLAHGGSDERVEELIPQVSSGQHSALLVETISRAMRKRLGNVVGTIDRIPEFGSLLAAIDAEAAAWAKKAVSREELSTLSANAENAVVVDELLKGNFAVIGANLTSIRHLVICMQGILLAIPMKDRTTTVVDDTAASTTTAATEVAEFLRLETVVWHDSKGRCDALLSLVDSLLQYKKGHMRRDRLNK